MDEGYAVVGKARVVVLRFLRLVGGGATARYAGVVFLASLPFKLQFRDVVVVVAVVLTKDAKIERN